MLEYTENLFILDIQQSLKMFDGIKSQFSGKCIRWVQQHLPIWRVFVAVATLCAGSSISEGIEVSASS